jgi:hypothetical protein
MIHLVFPDDRPCGPLRPCSFNEVLLEDPEVKPILLRPVGFEVDAAYERATRGAPRFAVNADAPPSEEAARFAAWCARSGLAPEHFCCMSEPRQEYWQAFARALSLPAMSDDLARALRHKPTMKRWTRDAGLRTAEFAVHEGLESALAFAETVGFPLVGKPVDGWGARETTRITDAAALRLWSSAQDERRETMLEALVPDEEYECCALIAGGTVLDRYVSKMPAPPIDVVHGAINANISLAACREYEPSTQVDAMVRGVVSRFGIERGYLHLEFFADSEGEIRVSELAVRYPGCEIARNHGLSLGFDIARATLDVYVGRKPDLTYSDRRCVGDLLLPYAAGTITSITGVEEIEALPGVISAHLPALHDFLPDVESASYNCAGWVFVEGPDPHTVERRMQTVLNTFSLTTAPIAANHG